MQYRPPGSKQEGSRPGTGQSMAMPGSRGSSRSPSPSRRQGESRSRAGTPTQGQDGVESDPSVLAFTTSTGRVVEKPLTLELLDLSENDIDCNGAADLAYALLQQDAEALNLQKNSIDDRGVQELLANLQYNQVIQGIVTLYNKSKDERVDRVLELRTAAVQALEDL